MHSCFLVLSFKAGNHWEISEGEAKQLSTAVANVARHYPIAASQKAADWGQLVIVAATIGAPRAVQSWTEREPIARRPAQQPGPAMQQPGPAAQPPGGMMPQTPSQLDPLAMARGSVTGTA